MNSDYFDVVIYKDTFCIVESAHKPHASNSAEITLKKIETILKNNLSYDEHHQHAYAKTDRSDLYRILKEKSAEIALGYKTKHAKLKPIARLLFRGIKQITQLQTSINNYAEPQRIINLPYDVIQMILHKMEVSDLGAVAKLSRHGHFHANENLIARAKKYGYEGTDPSDARKFLKDLFTEVYDLVYENVIPIEFAAYKKNEFDAAGTLNNLSKLSGKKFLQLLLYSKILPSANVMYKFIFLMLEKRLALNPKLDINKRNLKGETLLLITLSKIHHRYPKHTHLFIMNEKKRLVELLLNLGADPTIESKNYGLPILRAARYNFLEILKLFEEKGWDINLADRHGISALMSAIHLRNKEIVQFLLEKGADVNAKNIDGETPLHCAAYQNQVEVAELLIKSGANINARTITGETPLFFARFLSFTWLILKKNGAHK